MNDPQTQVQHHEVYYQSIIETARLSARLGYDKEATTLVERAVSMDSHDINALSLAGEIFMNQGQFQCAEDCFVKALTMEQRVTSIPIDYFGIRLFCVKNLCGLLVKQQRTPEAERLLVGEIQANGGSFESYLMLGDFYAERGCLDQAKNIYNIGRDKFPRLEVFEQRFRKQGHVHTFLPELPRSVGPMIKLFPAGARSVLIIGQGDEKIRVICKERGIETVYFRKLGEELPLDPVDVIWVDSIQDMEQEVVLFLKSMAASLTPGGMLLLRFANARYCGYLSVLAAGQAPFRGRYYTKRTAQALAAAAGFDILDMEEEVDPHFFELKPSETHLNAAHFRISLEQLSPEQKKSFWVSHYYFKLTPVSVPPSAAPLAKVQGITASLRIQELNREGLKRISEKRYPEASRCFFKVLEIDSKNAEAFNNLGLCAWYLGHVEEAFDMFRTAVQLENDFEDALHNLWDAALKLNRKDKAAVLLRDALSHHPELGGIKNLPGFVL